MSAFILLPISLLLLLLLLLKCSCGFTAKASSVVGSCLRSAQHAAEAAESCRRQTIFPDSPFFLHHHQISPKIVQRKSPFEDLLKMCRLTHLNNNQMYTVSANFSTTPLKFLPHAEKSSFPTQTNWKAFTCG